MEKEPLLHVVVDRSRWLRGEGEQASRLLRISDGKMCCLGFACLAAGYTEAQIADVATPNSLTIKLNQGHSLLPNERDLYQEYSEAMEANDHERIVDDDREAYLIKKLAIVGIEMTFVDGPVTL